MLLLPPICAEFSRCEQFNSIVREYNVHRQACSRDIVERFAKVEHMQLLPKQDSDRQAILYDKIKLKTFKLKLIIITDVQCHVYRCGSRIQEFIDSPQTQHYLYGTNMRELYTDKEIYQPGCLRKVDLFCTHVLSTLCIFKAILRYWVEVMSKDY